MVVVRLATLGHSAAGQERTYTDNVSARGACVISAHAWQPGEEVEVTSVKDGMALRGRVVHCQKMVGDLFAVGLSFHEQTVEWSSYKRFDGF